MTDTVTVTIDRAARNARTESQANGEHSVELEGQEQPFEAVVLASGPTRVVLVNGRVVSLIPLGNGRFYATRTRRIVEVESARSGQAAHTAGGDSSSAELRAPMPGRIVRVLVREGDAVVAGAGLIVIEAMKMENELSVSRSGTVKRLAVGPGDAVDRDTVLVEFE